MSDKKQEAMERRSNDSKRRTDSKRRQLDEAIPVGSDKRQEEYRRSDFDRRHQYEEQ